MTTFQLKIHRSASHCGLCLKTRIGDQCSSSIRGEYKHLILIILIIHIIISFDQNILLIFLCESWIHGQAKTSVLCLLYRPETVHCSKKKSYNSERIIMRGKLFQKSSHFVYCSILSLGGKVNTRRMSQPDMDMEH